MQSTFKVLPPFLFFPVQGSEIIFQFCGMIDEFKDIFIKFVKLERPI